MGPNQILLIAAVDLVGDAPESHIGEQLRRIERELEASPYVTEAILTPAAPSQATITPEDIH